MNEQQQITREPKVGDFCTQNYDGRICQCKVYKVDNEKRVFHVLTSFDQYMGNIPFDKFNYAPDLGNLIVNLIQEKYKVDLMTIDAIGMTDDINSLLQEKKWML